MPPFRGNQTGNHCFGNCNAGVKDGCADEFRRYKFGNNAAQPTHEFHLLNEGAQW